MFYNDIKIGATIEVATGWGLGKVVHGVVVGKEKIDDEEHYVVDYHVEGSENDNWAYDYQIKNVIKDNK